MAMRAVITITTAVEPRTSWRVDHATLVNSAFDSRRKFIGFPIRDTRIILGVVFYGAPAPLLAGAAGVEPTVTVLETVGLPLTDAPMPQPRHWYKGWAMATTLSLYVPYVYGKTYRICLTQVFPGVIFYFWW